MKFSAVLLAAGLVLTGGAQAQGQWQSRPTQGNNPEVVVNMPEEVWTQGRNTSQAAACVRCCTYGDKNYTEGAVVKQEGVLLQCARDKASLGTNNLIWQIIKQ